MPYTMDDFVRDYVKELFPTLSLADKYELINSMPLEERVGVLPLAQRLAGLTVEERSAGLTVEERLAGLPPETRFAGTTPEERLAGLTPEQIQSYLDTADPGDAPFVVNVVEEAGDWHR